MGSVRFLILAIAAMAIGGVSSSTGSVYEELIDHVIQQADDSHLPPIMDAHTPLQVGIHMGLQDIIDVDRINNLVDISLMVNVLWNSSITWNPKDYNNLALVALPRDQLWHPALAVLNAANQQEDAAPADTTIFSNGFTGTFFQFHVQVFCDLSSKKSNDCKASVGLSKHGYHLIRLQDPATIPVVEGIEKFFRMSRHAAPAWPLRDSRNVKTSYSMVGLPGLRERIDLEFSFTDSHRADHSNAASHSKRNLFTS